MTISKEKSITKLSLRELSVDSSRLWEQIEAAQREDDESQIGLVIQKLVENQDAMESKVDSIVWVKEMLESELAGWEERRSRALMLYDDAIKSRQDSIKQIKQMILHLHSLGLIPQKIVGKECQIEIRDNPPSVKELCLDVESEEFPNEFKPGQTHLILTKAFGLQGRRFERKRVHLLSIFWILPRRKRRERFGRSCKLRYISSQIFFQLRLKPSSEAS